MTEAKESGSFTLFVYLAAAFVAALVTANVLAAKIVTIGGLLVPAGVLAYSITFAVTDTVSEVWGRARSQALVNAGILVLLLVWGLVMLAVAMPAAPIWAGQAAFAGVLAQTNRIILASLVAFAVSQSFDVWVFHRLRRRTGAQRLWLRNNLSTVLSQTLDTVVFIVLAFAGTGLPLLHLIGGQLLVKFSIALLDTPVVYALVYAVRYRLAREAHLADQAG